MPEGINRKINYKIITAENLLGEKLTESKEIHYTQESSVSQEKEIVSQAEKEAVQTQRLAQESIPIPKETIELENKKIQETTEPIVKQEETLKELILPELEEKTKIKIPYKIVFSSIFVLAIVSLIIFLKPHEKIQNLIKKSTQTLPTSTPSIKFPLPTTSQTITSTGIEVTSTLPAMTTATETALQPSISSENLNFGEIISLKNIDIKNINLKELSSFEFEKELKQLLARQEYPTTLFLFNFVFQEKPLPADYFLDYFIKPKQISTEEINNFKKNIEKQYAFILYYSYTRKNPILIFKVKDPNKAKIFNQNWEKKNMAQDLTTLFFGFDPGKPITKFTSKKINGTSYRIISYKNNYQLIWLVYKNFLIYSTNENGLKKVIHSLP